MATIFLLLEAVPSVLRNHRLGHLQARHLSNGKGTSSKASQESGYLLLFTVPLYIGLCHGL